MSGSIPSASAISPSTSSAAAPSVTNSSTPSATSSINVNFINGIAIRILDKTGTSEITDLPMELLASPGGSFISDNFLVEVDTSNRTGYKLYMTSDYQEPSSPGTYTTALVNLEDSDYTIPTLGSTVTKADFLAGGNYVNHWGYSLDDTTYSPVPVHSTSDEIDTSSSPATHDQTAVYVAANVDLSKASGRYQNSLVFSAIANPIPTSYTLSFNLDGGSAPTSDPDAFDDMTASEVSASHTFTIPSTVPEKSGYSFQYWTDSSSNQYNPGDTITVIGNEEYIGSETLTAVWEEIVAKTIANSTYFQEVETCPDTLTIGTQYTLTDAGETSKSYTTSKLADGKCWMTQNYNLSGGKTLSSEYYNVPASGCNINGTDCTLPTSSTSGFVNNAVAYVYNSPTYGGYYSWKAATAGTNPSSGTASYDICPKNWRLPTQSETNALISAYSAGSAGSNLIQSPVNMLYGGSYYDSSARDPGVVGNYWSSATYDSQDAYVLSFGASSAATANARRMRGNSIRCVFDRALAVQTMQDMTSDIANDMATGQTLSLADAGEPSKTYSVAKLADGKVWMTENYNVSGGKTLTSEYYNVPSSNCDITGDGTCTLPTSSTTGFSDNSTAYVYNDSTYGGYYSWKAATAGTNPSSGDASNDICPKNWRLPTQTELSDLTSYYTTGASLTASPVNMLYGGRHYHSSTDYLDTYGLYWSSSANSSTIAYYLFFTSYSVKADNEQKASGNSIRCIFAG